MIEFRSSQSSVTSANGTLSLAAVKPTGVMADDMLIAIVTTSASSEPTITPPSGWTAISGASAWDTGSPGVLVSAYQKLATDAEPAAYLWAVSAATGRLVVTTLAYSGVHPDQPVYQGEAVGAIRPTSSTASTTASLAIGAGRMVVAGFAERAASTWASPAGTTTREQTTGTGNVTLLVVDSSTPASPVSWTATASVASSTGAQIIFALQERPLPGSPYKHWDGTKYVDVTAHRWNGTAYIPIEHA